MSEQSTSSIRIEDLGGLEKARELTPSEAEGARGGSISSLNTTPQTGFQGGCSRGGDTEMSIWVPLDPLEEALSKGR